LYPESNEAEVHPTIPPENHLKAVIAHLHRQINRLRLITPTSLYLRWTPMVVDYWMKERITVPPKVGGAPRRALRR